MKLPAILIAFWLAIAAAPAYAQDRMSPTEFRDYVVAKFKAQDSSTKVEVTGPLSITIGDGFANLDTGYTQYLADPMQLDNITRRWVQMFHVQAGEVEVSPDDVRERLVMLVRNSTYLAAMPPSQDASKSPVWRPLAGDLVVVMMMDYPTSRSSVTPSLLTNAKLTVEEAWSIAKKNSIAAMGPLGVGMVSDDGPLAIGADSGLATAILADPGVCSEKGAFGNAFMLVIDRDSFAIGRPDDPDSLKEFWDFARYAIKTGDFASSTPLTCQDGKIVEAPVPR